MGIIARDCNEDILALMCSKTKFVISPFLLGCNALWRSMELCKELGFREVIFEGDAKTVIDAMQSKVVDES